MDYAPLVGDDVVSISELAAFPHPCGSLRQVGAGLHPHGVYNPYAMNRVGTDYFISARGSVAKVGEKRGREAVTQADEGDAAESIISRWRAGGNAARYSYIAPHDTYRSPPLTLPPVQEGVEGSMEDDDEDPALELAMRVGPQVQGLTPLQRIDSK
jgi:hypothetical protein